MISQIEYTDAEIDQIYTAIEDSVVNKTFIDMDRILDVIHPGDFYLEGRAVGGLTFEIPGLYWEKDGQIYSCLIQPQIAGGIFPKWKVVITRDVDSFSSSGIKDFLHKENRVIKKQG